MATNNFEDLISGGGSATQASHTSSTNANQATNHTFDSNKEQINRETYTDAERADVNDIIVTIPDNKTPIVIFFGAQSSGKTLALLRLIRYLKEPDYKIVPEEIFRPKTDKHYTRMCEKLKDLAYNTYAPGGTDVISFMLVKVLDRIGKPICQILEAPGEHYFDNTASMTFPTYIHAIKNAPNRRVWVFFVEQGWGQDQNIRDLYAQKVSSMDISPKDKVIFLFNKVDKHRSQYDTNNRPDMKCFFNNIKQQYPGIFSKFENKGLFARSLFGQYNFQTVCFSAGAFNMTLDGREVWIPGEDWYCQQLWKALIK